eukprot:72805-Chlamydomonas_euryale.AAC.1
MYSRLPPSSAMTLLSATVSNAAPPASKLYHARLASRSGSAPLRLSARPPPPRLPAEGSAAWERADP